MSLTGSPVTNDVYDWVAKVRAAGFDVYKAQRPEAKPEIACAVRWGIRIQQ